MKGSVGLSDARQALLQRYLRGGLGGATATKSSTIPKRTGSGPAPLSYSQQQIWLHSQLAGEAPIYNEPETIHFPGELNVAALQRSFTEIVRRHEAWRTTFAWDGDQGVQIVHQAPERIEIPFLNLRTHPQPEREAIRLATEDALQPFDLAQGPMYRLRLVRLGEAEHRLFLALHHIIFDGVSLYQVFLPELQTLYEAFARNESPVLAELPIQYADYAAWQRASIKEIAPDHLSYWETVCHDLPVLDLQTDHPRPARLTYAGASERLQVPPATTAALKALSQEQGATPFMTMVASFMALLHGYSGQEDIVIGGITSGRQQTETMGLLGCFINTIPIRCAFSKDLPFTELLARVRTATLGALSHDEVPFELLVQKFAQRRDAGRAPLVQVLIVVEPPLDARKDGWGFTHMDVETGTAKFDLQLGLDDRPEGLSGRFIYNTDLFERPTIQLLTSRWLQLLDRIAAAPTQRVCDLTNAVWGNAGEPEKPLPEWNATRTNYPRDAAIHELFEEHARRTPSAIALIFGERQLSYDELNRRANRLARRLQKLGIVRDLPVGVCMERSTEMVIALLAVLKAGGAYVPLDPAYPAERLAFMIEDAGMSIILTDERVSLSAPGKHLLRVDPEEFRDEEDTNLATTIRAEDLAYVMYTSGSTGRPKGVAVPHRAVVRLVKDTDYASFSPNETFLQLAPISFDASTFEIWGPLLNGGKLVVMPPAPATLEDIGAAIREHGVTTLWLTAALFNAMVDERLHDLLPLRQLLTGGDVLSVEHVGKALRELKNTRLINGYGPTECTTFACCHTILPEAVSDGAIPIGKPIANTTAYILNEKLELVPVGASGELCLGGDGLARGYWQQEELTAEKFVADPFGEEPGARLYRTGDLARWRNDGVIEFLGRADNQIKLRGFRIEPGEIESTVKRYPGVRDCVVVASEETPGNKRLVAFIVCDADSESAGLVPSLMTALRRELPSYMIPSQIISLREIPRTSNGKTDRAALKLLASEKGRVNSTNDSIGDGSAAKVAPRDGVETQLCNIWEDLLGHSAIGVQDNFFDLGGHSLLAVQMLALVEKRLGSRIPIKILFEEPTIEHIAEELLRGRKSAAIDLPYVLMNPAGKETPVFFFHGDFGAGGFFCKVLANEIGLERPFYALHPHGFHGEAVPPTIEAMATDRVKLIREHQPRGPYILGGYCAGALVAYHAACLLCAAGEEVSALMMVVGYGTNIRFLHLKRLVDVISALCGDDEGQRQQRFLNVRKAYLQRENQIRQYLRRLTSLTKQPLAKQAARVWTFAGRKTGLIKSVKPAPAAPRIYPPIRIAYTRAAESFVGGKYDSPLIQFWPKDEPVPSARGPVTGWDRVCSQIEVVEVLGNHDSCVLRNSNASFLGKAMRGALARIPVS